MDASSQLVLETAIAGLLLALTVLVCLRFSKPKNGKKKQAPEPVGARPIMGHIHMLSGSSEQPHKTLVTLADQYGPVMKLRLGLRDAIVVSNGEMAKECFTTNDRVLLSRPKTVASKFMSYDFKILGFAPYGPYWREIRKIVMSELLSKHRLELLKNAWTSEISSWVKELHEEWAAKEARGPVVVDMSHWFGNLAFNIGMNIVAGKRFFGPRVLSDEDGLRRVQQALTDFFRLLGAFLLEDAVPFLSWWDSQGYEKEMKDTAREMDTLNQGLLDEHKRRRSSSSGHEAKGEKTSWK